MFWEQREIEHRRAAELAKSIGTEIPGDISLEMWMLPILEKMAQRINELESRIEEINPTLS